MNKEHPFILELLGMVLAIIGAIGMFNAAKEFVYRNRPSPNFVFRGDRFIYTAGDENNQDLVQRLLTAEMHYLLQKDQEAIDDLTQAIHDHPDYIESYYFRGLIYLSTGDVGNGVIDMQMVVDHSDDPVLRRQAKKEIVMTQLAVLLIAPIVFLGLLAASILFVLNELGVRVLELRRPTIMRLIAACVVWIASFIFLVLH